jgi:hypothetical protein
MWRKSPRPRNRIFIKVVLATFGLAGVVYAADQITEPGADGDIDKVITQQRVSDGQVAGRGVDEHQRQPLTPDQMIDLAGQYGEQMKAAAEHAETMRIEAYRNRDMIRMACIDDKLSQMRTVMKIAEPRLTDLGGFRDEKLVMQQHFSIVRQARDRVGELSVEVEGCSGDNVDPMYIPKTPVVAPSENAVDDPTRPPSPSNDIARPPEASVYR